MTSLNGWFEGMSGLTEIDIRNLNTTQMTNCNYMFKDCSNLITIYDAGNFNPLKAEGYEMFLNCINIVGGSETKYDAHCDNAKYAHIDGGEDDPGYFSTYVEPVNPPANTYKLLFATDDYNLVVNMYKSFVVPTNEQSYTYPFTYSNIAATMGVEAKDPSRLDIMSF